MKLSQTVGLGAAVAILPLVAGLAFSVDRLQDLASQSERLMLRQLTAVRLGTGVATRLDRLGEYESKYAVSHDGAYAEKAQQVARAIDVEVQSLRGADLGTAEDAALASFIRRWERYRARAWSSISDDAADRDDDDGTASRQQVTEIDNLAIAARELLANAHEAAIADVASATDTREAAWRAAVTATVIALLSSVTVLWVVVRRLRRRLDDFVDASVAVSRGAFSAQLPAGGDDELGRVATAFNDMVMALEQLERMKSDFISSISHELRTPLVAMVETNEALLDDVAGPLTDRQRRMITLNRGAAQRLSVMLGDLLELSVVRSGLRYRMGPALIDNVVNSSVFELEARARERGVSL
ncbi:MAG TPA: histidine kinase dimerization/phospho-acceptor domain-containing protein [Myxococcota bacterium]